MNEEKIEKEPRRQEMTRKNFIRGLFVLCICWALVFGTIDYGFGILGRFLYRVEGIEQAFYTLLYAMAFYGSLGLLFFIGIMPVIFIFKRQIINQDWFFSLLSGFFFGLIFLFVLPVLIAFRNYWNVGIGMGILLTWALFAGAGWYGLSERLLKNYQEKAFLPGLILVALLAGFNLLLLFFSHFEFSEKVRIISLLVSAGMGLLILGLEFFSFRKKALWPLIICGILFLTIFFLPLFYCMPEEPKGKIKGEIPRKVNVIFIIADACRADALGIDQGKNQTPTLDRLAREGLWFSNAHSQASWTNASVASFLTSQYPLIFMPYYSFYKIPFSLKTLPERLREYGYYTAGLVANHLLTKKFGYLQGFDYVYLVHQHHRITGTYQISFLPLASFWQKVGRKALGKKVFLDTTEILTEQAIQFLKKKPPKPFFLYIHYMDPHDPYDPPTRYIQDLTYQGPVRPPYFLKNSYVFYRDWFKLVIEQVPPEDLESKRFIRDLYDAEVRYLDDQMARLLEALKEQGLDKNTMIIFSADHGEEFWEHGKQFHAQTVYEEVLRVPLIIWGPGIEPMRIDSPVQLLDLLPSLSEYLGIPGEPEDQGKSFWKLVRGERENQKYYRFAEAGLEKTSYAVSIQDEKFKLIYQPNKKEYQFYDLETDPGEQKNILDFNHPAFITLKAELEDWLKKNQELRKKFSKGKVSAQEQRALEQRLRALGYIK